jgi:hypothetical protein
MRENSSNQRISVRRVRTSLRSTRLALFIPDDAGWQQNCLASIEWLSEVWGGAFAQILPVSKNGELSPEFWFLLEQFDPDYLFTVGATALAKLDEKIRKRLDPFHYQHCIFPLPAHVQPNTRPSFNHLTAVLPRVLKKRSYIVPDIGLLPTELSLIVASSTGLATQALTAQLTQTGGVPVNVLTKTMDLLTMDQPDDLLSVVFSGDAPNWRTQQNSPLESNLLMHTPFGQTTIGLGRYFPLDAVGTEDAVLIVGDECRDFCLYFCLSRLRADVYWLPTRLLPASVSGPDTTYLQLLYQQLIDKVTRQRQILITSCTQSTTGLDQAIATLPSYVRQRTQKVLDDVPSVLPYSVKFYEEGSYGLARLEQFLNDSSMNIVDTPVPRTLSPIPFDGIDWVIELWVDNYRLPRRASLAKLTLQPPHYTTTTVRLSLDGIAYKGLSPARFLPAGLEANLFRPSIYLIPEREVFSTLYSQSGLQLKDSDKGNYHRQVVRLFGDLDRVTKFMGSEAGAGLLAQYLDNQASASGKGVFLKDNRRYLDFDCIKVSSRSSSSETIEIIDDLISLKVLSRGFILKCEYCAYAGWYHVRELSERFECSRCRHEQLYLHEHWREPEEPRWYYDLSEVVYQSHLNSGFVPFLSLFALKKKTKECFLYVPESTLTGGVLGSGQKEIDFTASIDGDLYIGEATRSDRLGQTAAEESGRLASLKQIAEEIQARCVVLSTFDSAWSTQTQKRANTQFASSSVKLLLMTRADLPKFAKWERQL